MKEYRKKRIYEIIQQERVKKEENWLGKRKVLGSGGAKV